MSAGQRKVALALQVWLIPTAKDNLDQGVTVRSVNDDLIIELHISVSYGVNISAIVESIVNKVRYTVEEATDLKVSKVNVYIDALN